MEQHFTSGHITSPCHWRFPVTALPVVFLSLHYTVRVIKLYLFSSHFYLLSSCTKNAVLVQSNFIQINIIFNFTWIILLEIKHLFITRNHKFLSFRFNNFFSFVSSFLTPRNSAEVFTIINHCGFWNLKWGIRYKQSFSMTSCKTTYKGEPFQQLSLVQKNTETIQSKVQHNTRYTFTSCLILLDITVI